MILDILISDIISKGVYSQIELEEEELRDTTLNLWPITGLHSTTELCSLPRDGLHTVQVDLPHESDLLERTIENAFLDDKSSNLLNVNSSNRLQSLEPSLVFSPLKNIHMYAKSFKRKWK